MPASTVSRDVAREAVAALEVRATRTRTRCGEGVVAWRAWGHGAAVVLLHGATGSWNHWLRNVDALARRYRVLAPDMPGYGDSDMPAEPTAASVAAALSDGLDALVPAPAEIRIVGFSFGGIIAGLVAERQGARVSRLVLIGPNGMALPHADLPALRRIHAGMADAEVDETHRENLRAVMLAAPGRADDVAVCLHAENVGRARFRSGGIPESDTLLRALPGVRACISGIWGERDAFALPHLDERRRVLARFQPDLDFRVVPGAGHWVPYEAPDEVNRMLLEMLG
jgi:pimeloyl-ACP methyl ester carboxylesterase